MAQAAFNSKRVLIDKANLTVVIFAGAAAFLLVFSLVASKQLVSQMAYQNKVISAKRKTVKQLRDNKVAADNLAAAYDSFNAKDPNSIGGQRTGTDSKDGNNASIILDALPSKYDFPALATSIQKILTSLPAGQHVDITSITGTDDSVNQSASQTASAAPQAVAMPFEVSISGSYESIQGVINEFEHSIRPIQVQSVSISASDAGKVTADITAQTFYQAAVSLDLSQKETIK